MNLDKRIEKIENEVLRLQSKSACPEGMVKIPHDHYNYWYPKDYELYGILFGQWCELKFKNIPGITPEERKKRDNEAKKIEVELEEIKLRCVEISNPSREISEARKYHEELEKNIVDSLKAKTYPE